MANSRITWSSDLTGEQTKELITKPEGNQWQIQRRGVWAPLLLASAKEGDLEVNKRTIFCKSHCWIRMKVFDSDPETNFFFFFLG